MPISDINQKITFLWFLIHITMSEESIVTITVV